VVMAKGPGLPYLHWKRYWRGISFKIGDSGQRLILAPSVLNHIAKHQQADGSSSEAGGQLFARFGDGIVRVERATGPRVADRRSRYGYIPDRRMEQLEIDTMHRQGLHFIGDWHTHPERTPRPSTSDVRSIRQAFEQSKHHLNGFILLIAGTEPFPAGLFVSLYNSRGETAMVLELPETSDNVRE
jgi:integrative and conjugative element protein (TIGR02256 family)